ncbi:MAG: stage III sporulation protein AB [Lachnospiraceae bacterium]
MLKIVGSMLILTASVGGCLSYMNRFKEQERQLLIIKELLIILEKQLEYIRLPLAEIVEEMAKKAGAPFKLPLMEFTKELSKHRTEDVEALWKESLNNHKEEFCLSREEFGILLDIGRLLEPTDSRSQVASVELYKNRVDEKIQKIWAERGDKQKVYQSVCLLGGLVLIIVLL